MSMIKKKHWWRIQSNCWQVCLPITCSCGARVGRGKSSLIHALLNAYVPQGLRLVEVSREQLADLGDVVAQLATSPYKFIIFCDDLSFEANDPSYKALKSALEGSIFKTAKNVLIYATSNRRHLVPEHMSDNQNMKVAEGELHESEAVEEKISLSDRFGVWLSFYPFRQDVYLDVVRHWVSKLGHEFGANIDLEAEDMRLHALRWGAGSWCEKRQDCAIFCSPLGWAAGVASAGGSAQKRLILRVRRLKFVFFDVDADDAQSLGGRHSIAKWGSPDRGGRQHLGREGVVQKCICRTCFSEPGGDRPVDDRGYF